MDKIMETTRISYTVQQWPRRHYRAAIRRRSDDGVIWECEHDHEVIGQVVGSATDCAQQEWRRRSATSTVQ
jgi:hypothetical protein